MPWALRVWGVRGPILDPAATDPADAVGAYVAEYDPDAHDGWGSVLLDGDPAKAATFDTAKGAFEFWQRTSQVRPVRPDGLPNRPLTAFTVEVVRL